MDKDSSCNLSLSTRLYCFNRFRWTISVAAGKNKTQNNHLQRMVLLRDARSLVI